MKLKVDEHSANQFACLPVFPTVELGDYDHNVIIMTNCIMNICSPNIVLLCCWIKYNILWCNMQVRKNVAGHKCVNSDPIKPRQGKLNSDNP